MVNPRDIAEKRRKKKKRKAFGGQWEDPEIHGIGMPRQKSREVVTAGRTMRRRLRVQCC